MENVGKRSNKSIEEYRHNIKLLKYHLKKQQKLNETLRYKDSKKNKKQSIIKQNKIQQKHNLYSMLEIINTLNRKLKDMGISLSDIFRMSDSRYEGQVTKEQFMGTITKLKANLQENQINQMFYAIDSNLNGMLSSDQYSQFLWAHGGSESKQAFTFQKETSQKFLAVLKKKKIKANQLIKNLLNPIPLEDMNTQLKKLGLNINQIMILFKMWDPSLTGFIKHQVYLKSMENVKEKDEKQIQNQKYQKGIKELCVLFRDRKINPIQIFQLSDVDGKQGISLYELEEGFKKLLPEQTSFQIKKWINLINIDGDSNITKEEFVSAIRSFYSLQQIDNFSVNYQKMHPKLKKALAEEQIPAQKTIKQLSNIIEDNGFTKTQVFHKIDINHNGFIDKSQLLDGLKSLKIKIGLIGKILAVFDRDASGEIGLDQWLSILGEDLEMQIVDLPEQVEQKKISKQAKNEKKQKITKKQPEKSPTKIQKPKEISKSKQASKPKTQSKINKQQDQSMKASKKKNQEEKKPITQTKKQIEKKPSKVQESSKISRQSKKQSSQAKPLKDQDKNKNNSTKQKQKQKQLKQKDVKVPSKKSSKEPEQPFRQFADQQQNNFEQLKQTVSDEEINTNDLEKEIAEIYSNSPKKVKEIFSKCKKNTKKEGLNQKQLNQFVKELKPKNEYNDKILKKIFQDNCQSVGLITFSWVQKLIENYQLTVKQQKYENLQEKNPQSKKKESKIIESKPIQKPKQQQMHEQDYEQQFQNNQSAVKEQETKINKAKKGIQTEKRGENEKAFQDLENHKLQHQTISDQGYKLKNYIQCEKQMQLLQNKYKAQANSIKKNKKIYQDKTFAANLSSLTHLSPNESQIPNVTLLKWKHYKQIYKSPQLFKDSISPNDIRQGTLGDCYFLCSLAALAEYKNLIERLFEYYDIDYGYFLIWVCIDGQWKLIELDGYIPINPNGNKPAFSHGDDQELWVILLQKAYAKAYGNYQKINGGQPYEAIKDLSGAPGQSFCHNKQQIKIDDIWNKLINANKQQFMMTCGTDVDKQGNIKMDGHSQSVTNEGLVLGHAYSILDVRQYKKQRLIQLRNPWGETEWKGDWSDKSSKWTQQAKKQLNYNTFKEDGIFWMPFQAYFQKYNTTAINYIRPSYYYSSQYRKDVKSFIIIINENSFKHGFIMVTQKDHRKEGLPPNTPYNLNHMISLQYQKGKIIRQISNQKYLYQREGSVQILSNPKSQVIVLVNLQRKTNVTLCAYADVKFTYQINEQSEKMMKYIEDLATMEERAKNIQETPNMFKTWMASVGQYAFLAFKSVAKKNIAFQVQLTGPKNMELIPKNNKVDIKIKPGETKCVRGRILNLKDSYSFGPLQFSMEDI